MHGIRVEEEVEKEDRRRRRRSEEGGGRALKNVTLFRDLVTFSLPY